MSILKGHIPWNKGTKGLQVAWNKGLKGYGTFNRGRKRPDMIGNKFMAGYVPWNKGLTKKDDSRIKCYRKHYPEPIITKKVCPTCKKVFFVDCNNKRTIACSRTCKDVSKTTGENSIWWKGGISKLIPYKHYKNKEYKNWRKQVFERDDYTCQECGARSGKGKAIIIHPHHKKSYTYFKSLRYELNNGVTLCICCHKKKHSKHK